MFYVWQGFAPFCSHNRTGAAAGTPDAQQGFHAGTSCVGRGTLLIQYNMVPPKLQSGKRWERHHSSAGAAVCMGEAPGSAYVNLGQPARAGAEPAMAAHQQSHLTLRQQIVHKLACFLRGAEKERR